MTADRSIIETGTGIINTSVSENLSNRADVIVVGGGPAGLSAALYLARFDRSVLLFDAGQGRSTWHQTNHNYLGFPGGVPARRLRELGREQLGEYSQVRCLNHKIETLQQDTEDGGFVASGQAGRWSARAVVLATGVIDHYPHFEGWDEYVGRSMFWCITCDGYACKSQRVIVAGNLDETASETLQLQRFTTDLTLLTNSNECEISETFQRRLADAGIPLVHDRIERVIGEDGMCQELITVTGQRFEFDQLFSVQGSTPQSELARDLGVKLTDMGYIVVDSEQKTSVTGVYAAGDVTRLHSHQITTAVHEGGQAAQAANYFLYPPELKDE